MNRPAWQPEKVESTTILGILVAEITRDGDSPGIARNMPESSYYRRLSEASSKLGVQLYIYDARGYRSDQRMVGYSLHNNDWHRCFTPLPDILYDRCFYRTPVQRRSMRQMLERLQQAKPFVLLGSGLPSKLQVYTALRANQDIAQHLPPTLPYSSPSQVLRLLRKHQRSLICKPASGMQGKGVLLLSPPKQGEQVEGPLDVRGRTASNTLFCASLPHIAEWQRWLEQFIAGTPYMLQPYLPLTTANHQPFDLRALMQKDEQGRWQMTGTVIRAGKAHAITSNLHGGGSAFAASQWLSQLLGEKQAERLLLRIHTISMQVTRQLESRFGRLAELGLDYGIEQEGRIWLLEANTKPGRGAFRLIDNKEAARQSVERPLQYARLLHKRVALRQDYVNNNHGHLHEDVHDPLTFRRFTNESDYL